LQLVAGGGRYLRDFGPSAEYGARERTALVCCQSDKVSVCANVGPDDGFHPAFEGVRDGQDNYEDTANFSEVPSTTLSTSAIAETRTLRYRAGNQESAGSHQNASFRRNAFR